MAAGEVCRVASTRHPPSIVAITPVHTTHPWQRLYTRSRRPSRGRKTDSVEGRASCEELRTYYQPTRNNFFDTKKYNRQGTRKPCLVARATGAATSATSPPTAPRPSDCATTARKLVSIGDDDLSNERAGDLQRRACQKFSLRRGERRNGWLDRQGIAQDRAIGHQRHSFTRLVSQDMARRSKIPERDSDASM